VLVFNQLEDGLYQASVRENILTLMSSMKRNMIGVNGTRYDRLYPMRITPTVSRYYMRSLTPYRSVTVYALTNMTLVGFSLHRSSVCPLGLVE